MQLATQEIGVKQIFKNAIATLVEMEEHAKIVLMVIRAYVQIDLKEPIAKMNGKVINVSKLISSFYESNFYFDLESNKICTNIFLISSLWW